MDHLPLFVSIGAFLVWALSALLMTPKSEGAGRAIGLGAALAQLGGALWAAARIASGAHEVRWKGAWFSVSASERFDLQLGVDPAASITWVTISIFALAAAYFAFFDRRQAKRPQTVGEAMAPPLLGLGALFLATATNFLPFFFGWLLLAVVGFLAAGLSDPADEERATGAMRYGLLNMLAAVVFSAGMIGCVTTLNTLSFSDINEKAASLPGWVAYCLVAGAMLRAFQFPAMHATGQVAVARSVALPILFIGHLAPVAALFAKLQPAIVMAPYAGALAAIPAFSALAAAASALRAKEPAAFAGKLAAYVAASVLLSGLAGDYQASQALAVAGAVSAYLLCTAMRALPAGARGSRGWFVLCGLVAAGLPIGGWGWARYLEYWGLLNHGYQLLAVKVVADLVMGIAIWGVASERWHAGRKTGDIRWGAVLPLAALLVASLSVAMGGRPLGGMAGQLGLDVFRDAAWFERSVFPLGSAAKVSAAMDALGSDQDMLARVLALGALVVPMAIAIPWLFRDAHALAEFRAVVERAARRAGAVAPMETILWDWCVALGLGAFGSAAVFFEERILDPLFSRVWLGPIRMARRVFSWVDAVILEKLLVDGIGRAVGGVGKSLRLIQNGQVQFYFGLGLALMAAIVFKFVVMGG